MVKRKCKCKKRGRRRKVGRPKGSKNKKGRKKTGGALPALAVMGAKALAPMAIKFIAQEVIKKARKGRGSFGRGLRLL